MAAPKKTKSQLNGARALTDEERARVRETEEEVMNLRIKGVSFRQIEKMLGISNADRVFKRAMARTGENTAYVRAEAIRVEAERLDALQEGLWERATNGNARDVEVALKVLERRAKLFGLDFADMLNARAVEIEETKVKMMFAALTKALEAAKVPAARRRDAMTTFLGELKMLESADSIEGELL